MDELLKELETAADLSGNITFLDASFVLVLSETVLVLVIESRL